LSTLVLGGNEVRKLLDMTTVITAVEQAFRELSEGHARMPAKAYLVLEQGDFRAMPAAVSGAVGIKWVNVHPQNPSRGLPTVMGILIYNDPSTGYPLAVMDATEITAYRTGAASAIASKYLARKDSHTLGIFGAGRQAHTQLLAHAGLFDFTEVRVFDKSAERVDDMIQRFPQYHIVGATPQDAAASDIVCTVTPARTPVIMKEWIVPGTHINAVGADAAGKEELEPSILQSSTVVVDDVRQATAGGEINVPVKTGLFRVQDIYATLGDVVAGKKHGRTDNNQGTIFDSTGIAIEDIAVARLIYSMAVQSGDHLKGDFVQT
jgi:alanine dehydrogenase